MIDDGLQAHHCADCDCVAIGDLVEADRLQIDDGFGRIAQFRYALRTTCNQHCTLLRCERNRIADCFGSVVGFVSCVSRKAQSNWVIR